VAVLALVLYFLSWAIYIQPIQNKWH
jgi:hypothetical protein